LPDVAVTRHLHIHSDVRVLPRHASVHWRFVTIPGRRLGLGVRNTLLANREEGSGMGQADLVMGGGIGGTGVKAALVDTAAGTTTTERLRVETPQPATPDAIIGAIVDLQKQLKWKGPIGCGFPGLVKGGIVHRCPHLDASWDGHELIADLKKR